MCESYLLSYVSIWTRVTHHHASLAAVEKVSSHVASFAEASFFQSRTSIYFFAGDFCFAFEKDAVSFVIAPLVRVIAISFYE